jgi:hypothetical protein
MKPALKALGCAATGLLGGIFAMFLLSVVVSEPALINALLHLTLGWLHYLFITLPEVSWNWEAIASGTLYLFLSAAGFHYVARSIARSRDRCWRWKWSLCFTLLFALVFGVSLTTSAIIQQASRLSREPKFYSPRYDFLQDTEKVRNLVSAVKIFSSDYGRYPTRLEELLATGHIEASTKGEALLSQFSSNTDAPPAPFIYVRGLSESAPGNMPLIIISRPIESRLILGLNDGSVSLMKTSEMNKALLKWKEQFATLGLPLPPIFAQYGEPKNN